MAVDVLTDPSLRIARYDPSRPSRVPLTLYRLQLSSTFTFADARDIVSYLAALGVTDAYFSPCLMAGRGSTHGYDIADHSRINPDLGDEEALRRLSSELRAEDIGLVLDIVPNHMGIDPERNRWWQDVLRHGQASLCAHYFDIDWTPVKRELEGRVLLPILGDQYGCVLERGELTLHVEQGDFHVAYGDRRLPLDPRETQVVLRHDLERLQAELGDDDEDLRELLSILTALQNLPPRAVLELDAMRERLRESEVARDRLKRLVARAPAVARHVERAVAAWNGTPNVPATFDRLHALLEAQAYRLAYWRTAADEINYRRFFDVNELAAVRMENPDVFDAAHRLLFDWIADGVVTGLRIDHPDGLFDPIGYAARLQERIGARLDLSAEMASHPEPRRPFYVAVEKILSTGEPLPAHWAVHGTTTYRFLNLVNSVFVDGRHATALRRMYGRITGRRESFDDLVYRCKRLIMTTSMASELNVLAHALNDLSESDRRSRDFTLSGLRKALIEVVACFPAYRAYVTDQGIDERDRRVVGTAVAEARRRNPALEATIFEFVRSVFLPQPDADPADAGGEGYRRKLAFAMKAQQYTGPVYAKSVEDTAFYRYGVLVSLNEVGGDPSRIGRSVEEFHYANGHRRERWPLEMIGTATHDTKRGEDTRARINVLSELPDAWRREVGRWMRVNASARTEVDGHPAPDRADEYLFYQTLVGVWPPEPADAPVPSRAPAALVERLSAYMLKAIKEAKVHTSWVSQEAAYETAVRKFVERTLTERHATAFLASFVPFQRRVARLGLCNALSQLVLKITSPGVVDIYQGTELWDFSLVDPDNRRPVDFASRRRMLEELEPLLAETDAARRTEGVRSLLATWEDGRVKLFVSATLLRARRDAARLYVDGDYLPLAGSDELARTHAIAYARRLDGEVHVTVAPRLVGSVGRHEGDLPTGTATWGESALEVPAGVAARTFVDLITGRTVPVAEHDGRRSLRLADVLAAAPVALLREVS